MLQSAVRPSKSNPVYQAPQIHVNHVGQPSAEPPGVVAVVVATGTPGVSVVSGIGDAMATAATARKMTETRIVFGC